MGDDERSIVVELKNGRKIRLPGAGGMMTPFYDTLPRDERKCCTLRLTLRAIHDFLVDPLAAWKLDSKEAVAQTMQPILSAYRQQNAERFEVIQKYAKIARHPELFAVPPAWKEEWFHPDFWRASHANSSEAWRNILTEHLPGEIFSFPIFTE